MGAFGIWQWIIILAIVLILFARPGRISGLMGDFGKGMNKFKTGLKDGDDEMIEAEDADESSVAQEKVASSKTSKKKATRKKQAAKKKKAKAKS